MPDTLDTCSLCVDIAKVVPPREVCSRSLWEGVAEGAAGWGPKKVRCAGGVWTMRCASMREAQWYPLFRKWITCWRVFSFLVTPHEMPNVRMVRLRAGVTAATPHHPQTPASELRELSRAVVWGHERNTGVGMDGRHHSRNAGTPHRPALTPDLVRCAWRRNTTDRQTQTTNKGTNLSSVRAVLRSVSQSQRRRPPSAGRE
jgi:hypothetical protein